MPAPSGKGRKLSEEVADILHARSRHRDIKDTGDYISKLRFSREEFGKVYDFKPGDLVTWKKHLKNRTRPALNEPAIVVQVLETPLFAEKESGSPYFNEPLSLVLGTLDEDEDFAIYHHDIRRFEPYQDT